MKKAGVGGAQEDTVTGEERSSILSYPESLKAAYTRPSVRKCREGGKEGGNKEGRKKQGLLMLMFPALDTEKRKLCILGQPELHRKTFFSKTQK